jgi:hypothetical protein
LAWQALQSRATCPQCFGLKRDRRGKRQRARKVFEDLSWGYGRLFLSCYLREGLGQLCVAVVLTSGGLGDGLLSGGELRGELGAVAAIGLPGNEDGDGQENGNENLCEL